MNDYLVRVNGKEIKVGLKSRLGSKLEFEIEGKTHQVDVSPLVSLQTQNQALIERPHAAPALTEKVNSPHSIVAPMPGIMVNLLVKAGDQVNPGQTVAVIEAMKMENNITVSTSAKVKTVHVKKGDEVQNGQLLITLN